MAIAVSVDTLGERKARAADQVEASDHSTTVLDPFVAE